MLQPYHGTGIAIVTPFKSDLSIDFEALKNIVNFNIDNGVEYIVIMGTTGESVTVTKSEKQEIIACVKEANNGRVPLVLGIGGNNTMTVIEEIKQTDFTGISAILSVSPYYSKPTQEGIIAHFKAVAEVCPVDIILYNVPGRTSKNMEVSTVLTLAKDCKNIVAVKEAGNNMMQYFDLINNKPDNFAIISGDDDLALAVTLAGGAGVISVIGQGLPANFTEMIRLGLQGKAKEAYQLYYRLLPSINLIFEENNPAGIKAVLAELELCNDTVRLPLVPASVKLKEKIKLFLAGYKC